MDKIILKASRRDVIGKKVKVLRREGKLPAVIYGYNMEPLPILLDLRETTKQLREVSRATVLTVDVSGDKHTVLVRERQRGVLSGLYEHIDFLAISMTETVRTEVNIFVEGSSPAEEEFGAIIMTGADSVEVEALPGDLPESLIVDVSSLTGIGDTITVADLVLPKGVTVLSDSSEMLAVVTLPAQALAEEEEEIEDEFDEDVEPEVIGREEDEDEE
ncbi:MAG TPA: 50S ribosomal protein L25 [Anaerolineales bacterium]|jgi:large subunit ribosomal protein L25|nr:50S ribosomal protein L25 [Anaerolineales bacterium]